MQKMYPFFLLFFVILLAACHSEQKPVVVQQKVTDTTRIFPVTSFLKGQLNMLDTLPVTPLKVISENGKSDSVWLKRPDIRKNASPFLFPVIDSASMFPFFTEKTFLDQTINAFTFAYDPKTVLPDSLHLTHWDVYMNPQTNSVDRIYMVKQYGDTTIQLTWRINKWYSIRTIIQQSEKNAAIKEEKMIWDFD